jgi:hypothetical protein
MARLHVTVCLIRIVTPDGQLGVLATNLPDRHTWLFADFSALYHRLNFETVTGLSWLTHQKDLGPEVLGGNLNTLLSLSALAESEAQIAADTPGVLSTSTGTLLKLNRTRAFAYIR